MASLAYDRIEEVDRKAKTLLSQFKASGKMKQDDLIALKQELDSETFKKEILDESTHEIKSAVNTEVLVSVVSNFYELIECLNQSASELTEEVKELKQQVENLAKQLEELKKDGRSTQLMLEELKKDRTQLMVGQLAFEVEKAIIYEVLTKVIGSSTHYVTTLEDMQSALNRKPNFTDVLSDPNQKKAAEKWEELQKTLKWKEIHFRYIKNLKSSRVSVAHPKFDAAIVANAIKEKKVGQHEVACKELMTMLKQLQKT